MQTNNSLVKKAEMYNEKGAWSRAFQTYVLHALVVDNNEQQITSLANASQMLINIGQEKSAALFLESLIDLAEERELKNILYKVYYHLGWAYYDLEQYIKAEEYLNKAKESKTWYWQAYHHLARILLDTGMIENDEKKINTALSMFTEHNDHFNNNEAFDFRLIARCHGALYVLHKSQHQKEACEMQYQKAIQMFEEKDNAYWPLELRKEREILLKDMDLEKVLSLQKYLRDKREKTQEGIEDLSKDKQIEYFEKVLDEFENTAHYL